MTRRDEEIGLSGVGMGLLRANTEVEPGHAAECCVGVVVDGPERAGVGEQLEPLRELTMVVCGRHDAATPLRHSEAIAASIEDSQLLAIDDAGHMVITERPDTLTSELAAWFAQHQEPNA